MSCVLIWRTKYIVHQAVFLTSFQLCSCPRISQHCMECIGSVLCSQEPSTGPCLKPTHLISPRSILTLSTHLHLGLPSGLYPSFFLTNILYEFLFSPIHATCLVSLFLHDFIMAIIPGEGYKLWSSSLCSFLQSFGWENYQPDVYLCGLHYTFHLSTF
jgi:hypothetical protein